MIEIREARSALDLKSVESLQRAIWGAADIDILSPLSLRAAIETGAPLLGAYDGAEMIGFSYGFLGLHNAQIEVHSDMTGLLPAYRDLGIGYKLKLAQRAWCLTRGIRLATWTFDPLRSRNAYFNFWKLGATSASYRVNFYGDDSTSFLHRNSTDRLWITWELDSPRVVDRLAGGTPEEIEGQVYIGPSESNRPVTHQLPSGAKAVIEVPRDPDAIEAESLALAREWRTATRAGFLALMEAGFVVTNSKNGRYQLERGVLYSSRYLHEMGS